MTQVDFAHLARYSRSSVGNVETGRQTVPRRFWQHADRELGAGGVLLAASDQVDALARDCRAQAARVRDRERRDRRDRITRRVPAVPAAAEPVSEAVPEPCGCAVTVGRWTGRETRALREAMRLGVRAFAEHLGVSTATVSQWESHRDPAPPRLATQAVLDQALRLADADVRSRFRLLALGPPDDARTATTDPAARRLAGATVTPIHRPHSWKPCPIPVCRTPAVPDCGGSHDPSTNRAAVRYRPAGRR